MCVICYVPRGVLLPKKETIKAMWDKNPHGAGVMYKTPKNEVFYKKGYFDFEEFYDDLVKISDRAVEIGIHCRIATSGGINNEMCHPFPLSTKESRLRSLFGNQCSEPIIMHNGIININLLNTLSDTCSYIVKRLYPRYLYNKTFMFNDNVVKNIENEIGSSKLLIMSQFPTKMIGNWQKDNDGCFYSNLYFKPFDYSNYYSRRSMRYNDKFYLFDDNCLISYDD